jgi:hypothetical protein
VYSWSRRDGRWDKRRGKDAEKAIAYLPSNDAHIMLRKKTMMMEEKGWTKRYGLFNLVHDSVVFHCPTELVDECAYNIRNLLEEPVMELADDLVARDGFRCRTAVSIGDDWAKDSMQEVHI